MISLTTDLQVFMLNELEFKRRVRYEKKINTLEEFVQFVQNAVKNKRFVYRGMNNRQYLCVSSFYRYYFTVHKPVVREIVYNEGENAAEMLPDICAEDFLKKSFDIIDEFNSRLLQIGAIDKELSFSDACSLAQHYELPTNLIDFTFDPAIALFFACSGNDDVDAVVFESDIWHPINVLNAHSQHGVNGWYKDPEKAHADIVRRLTSIDKTTEISLTTPEIHQSMLEHNERIKRQLGVFVYNAEIFPYDRVMYNFWDEPYCIPGRIVYVINKALKPLVREHLESIGVTWEYLMPSDDAHKIKQAVKETKLQFNIPERY